MVYADNNNPTVVDADSKRLLNKIQTIGFTKIIGEETKGRCQKYPGGGSLNFRPKAAKP